MWPEAVTAYLLRIFLEVQQTQQKSSVYLCSLWAKNIRFNQYYFKILKTETLP